MSYCRFSSDGFRSDVYCWHDVGGFYATMVAGCRYKNNKPPKSLTSPPKTIPIDLPHAGERFCDPDLPSFLKRLMALRVIGYHVPDGAIERIQQEMAAPETSVTP